MNVLVIGIVFVAALLVALLRGPTWAFVTVYLPSTILLNQVPEYPLPHLPIGCVTAPLYAILIALPFRSDGLRFRPCSVDAIMVLLLISSTITAWSTELFETGINTFRTDAMTWTVPYFLARVAFQNWPVRRTALNVLIGVMAVVSVAVLLEMRGTPYFYLHMLQKVGMGNRVQGMAYYRYGLNRVAGPVEHPIYFGNMCVVLLGMIAVLARTSGQKLSKPLVGIALFATFSCVIASISFTPYLGMIAGLIAFALLVNVRFLRRLVLPGTILLALALFGYTYHLATTPLGAKPEGQLPGSLYTRKLIVHESWKQAVTAGPFGWGLRHDFASTDEEFDLASVDNSYMQFTMTRGWTFTALWASIAIFFAWRVSRGFAAAVDRSQIVPLAAATGTVLALMVSMYTVWAGALYTVIWMVMLGLSNTLIDTVIYGPPKTADARRFAPGAARPGRTVVRAVPVGVGGRLQVR